MLSLFCALLACRAVQPELGLGCSPDGVNPGGDEVPYDGVDNDCDASTPDDDLDADGFPRAVDCDDEAPAVNPGTREVPYDAVDNDCEPDTPDDDADGDGFRYAADCDDDDSSINPVADEVPYDGIDNDCYAGTPDDDLDGDGVLVQADCDDGDPAINPDQVEVPGDGVDNDCDARTPDADADVDADGDGYGPDGDCDDDDATVFPSAEEDCDGLDNDCLGDVDEDGCWVEVGVDTPQTTEAAVTTMGTYQFILEGLSWENGHDACNSIGMELVTLSSAAEAELLHDEVTDIVAAHGLTDGGWWTGFTDAASEGSWVWVSGEAVTYTRWGRGEPNESDGASDCAYADYGDDSEWNDAPCTIDVLVICEW